VSKEPEIVWLSEERTYGLLVNLGAFYSTVHYRRGGMEYEILVENTDMEIIKTEDEEVEQD
jgi:hypothetical protein